VAADKTATAKDERAMLYGIGVDVVKISRFDRIWRRSGDLLAATILLDDEYRLFVNAPKPAIFLAEKFAAKEAIVKAMGTGFADGMWVTDVGTIPGSSGQIEIVHSERGRGKWERLGIAGGHISITRCDELVCAVAVLLRTDVKFGN
jgi:holo-[acyl-carrier protein] synthase